MILFGRKIPLKLRVKFVLPIGLILIVGMTVASAILIDRQSQSFRRELETAGQTMLRVLAVNAESGVLFESKYELEELLKAPMQFESVEYAIITNAESKILAQAGNRSNLDQCAIGSAAGINCIDSICLVYVEDADEQEHMVLCMPVVTLKKVLSHENLGMTGGLDNSLATDSEREIIGHIELGLSLDGVNAAIHQAQATTILFTVIVVILVILIVTVIVRAVTKPLKALVAVTDQVSRGDLSQRVKIESEDEIAHLGETFNRMIESLKQSRDEIEAYNRNLEQKIVERSKQLEDTQALLIQSEKMSAIGQLAAGVAHELNNPLGGILGYAQFTLEKLHKNTPEKTSAKEIQSYIRYLTDIEIQSRRCKTIVQNLLRFSRSTRTMEFEDVDINKAIEDTVTFVEHQLHLNQIELELALAPNLPILQGNTSQLQQVFTNLIINAMHASPANSAIRVATRLSPALGEFGGAVEIQVIDKGCGIDPENLNKIFEPFFTTKEIGKGTGLGLSVSYGIVKEHGGEISVNSVPGKGSTFTIILPLQKPEMETDTETDTTLQFSMRPTP